MDIYINFPTGPFQPLDNPDMLKDVILTFSKEFWTSGACGVILKSQIEGNVTIRLLILPNLGKANADHCLYLKLVKSRDGIDIETWLSLGDRAKLDEVTECGDEWFASVGLFLKPELAWAGVEYFIHSSDKSSRIEWIKPSDVPAKGNW